MSTLTIPIGPCPHGGARLPAGMCTSLQDRSAPAHAHVHMGVGGLSDSCQAAARLASAMSCCGQEKDAPLHQPPEGEMSLFSLFGDGL